MSDDLADRIIEFIEGQGRRVEIWQGNILREWWGGPRRCLACREPTDGNLCAMCKFGRAEI